LKLGQSLLDVGYIDSLITAATTTKNVGRLFGHFGTFFVFKTLMREFFGLCD
jgi:hypothetical protein